MRYSFLSPHYWRRNRDRKIKKIAQGHSLSKKQNCNLNLVNTTSKYYAILLLYSKRINNGRYFHSAAHSCKYFSILELLVSTKNSVRCAHFLFTPSYTLRTSRLCSVPWVPLGLIVVSMVSGVFSQREFPAWDQKEGHEAYYPSSLLFGSLWVGRIPFQRPQLLFIWSSTDTLSGSW